MTVSIRQQRSRVFPAAAILLVAAAAYAFLSLWQPLVLAAWVAVLVRPLLLRVAKVLGGRQRAAGALTVALVTLLVVPLALAVFSLAGGAIDLLGSLLDAKGVKSGLISVASGGDGAPSTTLDGITSPRRVLELVQEHGAQAWSVARGVAGTATQMAVALFVFVYAVYVFLVDGPDYYTWLESHCPLEIAHTRRLVAAFNETGRGLFVSIGLTGLAQGIIATITYFCLGVPRALVLGLLTCIASLIPSVGTALVWIPVAIGLGLSERTGAAAIMTGVGVLVIGTIDNILRPVFARLGELQLPTFVLLTSIFGGLAIFGPWGLVLGPLFVRLAKEALEILRSRRDQSESDISEASSPSA